MAGILGEWEAVMEAKKYPKPMIDHMRNSTEAMRAELKNVTLEYLPES